LLGLELPLLYFLFLPVGRRSTHNERAEWIRKKGKGKLGIWIGGPYRLWKLFCTCQKLTIGNLLEMIKFKITDLKLSQLLAGILKKTLMQ
jgi:hypothetical protein